MTLTVGTSGGNKDILSITVGTSGGNKTVLEGWVGTASGNRLWYSAFTGASRSPASISGQLQATLVSAPFGDAYALSGTTTGSVTATPNDGAGPFNYAWQSFNWTDGGFQSISITPNSPSSATTSYSISGLVGAPSQQTVGLPCIVTDTASGVSHATPNVTITFTYP